MLRIAKFDNYDITNNPKDTNSAFTIWFSGCTFGCNGCHNEKLQSKESGKQYDVEQVLYDIYIDHKYIRDIKTVVLLGGEPLQQDVSSLTKLCKDLHKNGIKIWLYTGYDIDIFDDGKYGVLLQYLHTLKCGLYKEDLKQEGFPSSSNQRVYRINAGDCIDITNTFREVSVQ